MNNHSSSCFITRREASWAAGAAVTKIYKVDVLNNIYFTLSGGWEV